MKTKLYFISLLLLTCILNADLLAYTFSGGSGKEYDPYLISSKADLEELADAVNNDIYWSSTNKYFLQTKNITDTIRTVIGRAYYDEFRGNYDGGGYEIIVGINMPDSNDVGLFGCVEDANLQNIRVSGYVVGRNCVGGLAGTAFGSFTISNCYTTCSVTGSDWVGGGIGLAYHYESPTSSTITNFYTIGNILGNVYVGGLVGEARAGNYNHTPFTISNCYTTGNIMAIHDDYKIGGLIGNIDTDYGYNKDYLTINNSYYLNTSYHKSAGGTPKTEAEMKSAAFVKMLNSNQNPVAYKFDSCGINNGYPILVWQPVCDGITDDASNVDVIIYPNATTFTATLIANGIEGEISIEITDLTGAILQTFTAISNDSKLETTIDLSSYAPGMYFVKLQNKKQIAVKQIIKK